MTILIKTVGAFFAVISFSWLLELPRQFTLWCGAAGAVNWLVYLLVADRSGSKIFAAFLASLAVAIFSHKAARVLKAPTSAFLIPGILPVVPGASIYNTVYSAIQNKGTVATYYFMETMQFAGAIAVAIFMTDTLFRLFRRRDGRQPSHPQ